MVAGAVGGDQNCHTALEPVVIRTIVLQNLAVVKEEFNCVRCTYTQLLLSSVAKTPDPGDSSGLVISNPPYCTYDKMSYRINTGTKPGPIVVSEATMAKKKKDGKKKGKKGKKKK